MGSPQLPRDTQQDKTPRGEGVPSCTRVGDTPGAVQAEVMVSALKLLLWVAVVFVVVSMVLLGDAGPALAAPNEGD